MQGVFLDRGSVGNDLDFSSLEGTLEHWSCFDQTSAGEIAGRIRNCEVVVSNKVPLDAPLLEQATALKLICVAATGTNNVDLDTARKRGIPVCNVTAYATPSVVEHVFALILGLTRRLHETRQLIDDGAWQRSDQFCLLDLPMRELAGATLGIVGYGELGRRVAEVAKAFGMEVLIAQRPGTTEALAGRLALEELLPRVDILSLHCPLTPDTAGLIGPAELAAMKPESLLINTARGGLVDEPALHQALIMGTIAGAGIDVLASEPPAGGNILLDRPLPNLIVTPHVAWASRAARQRLLDQVADNIRAWQAGDPRNRVA